MSLSLPVWRVVNQVRSPRAQAAFAIGLPLRLFVCVKLLEKNGAEASGSVLCQGETESRPRRKKVVVCVKPVDVT